MGVRTERDRHAFLKRELEDFAAGINFPAILAQTGGVEFDGAIVSFWPRSEIFRKAARNSRGGRWPNFFGKSAWPMISKKPVSAALRQPLEISGPDFIGVAMFPFGQFLRVVNGPGIGDVMHRADEIIPRMPRGEFADPILVTGQIIHFEREADGQLRKILLRLADLGDVFVELVGVHPPVVEIVLRHRRMVGEADFRQADGQRARGVFARLAGRVPAKRRVHVIIGGPLHGVEC